MTTDPQQFHNAQHQLRYVAVQLTESEGEPRNTLEHDFRLSPAEWLLTAYDVL
jgi:hypothetical protein